MRRILRQPFLSLFSLVFSGLIVIASATSSEPKADDAVRSAPVSYARDIQPLLAQHCIVCHGPDTSEAGLRLDIADAATAMLETGARAIVPGDMANSELLQRVTADDASVRMPPDTVPLASADIDRLRQWIAEGAGFETHWAYSPAVCATPPEVMNQSWARNPIDQFVMAKWEHVGLEPASEADRATLIKRLYYDLLGLPPAPAEVDSFINDSSEQAYERLVDRLLSSVQFGERWGRHWLDKARYADSDGYEKDRPRFNAWRYRDWVIQAINDDLPFNEFTIQQLAGDLLPEASPMQKLATAFHRQTLTNTEGGADQEEFRVEATFDRTETTAAVWMGLTLGCARCHSHKYDQISHQEYYQLFAFFDDADEAEMEWAAGKQYAAMAVPVLAASQRTTRILNRGDFLQPAEEVDAGVLEVIGRSHPLTARDPQAGPDRLDMARWLMSPEHPLTSRVIVNQVWGHLFGRGIVATVNDFGVRGEPPTHPELLDWLAWQFGRSMNWSRKALIRALVTSSTYRQSSHYRPELDEVDPTNRWFARQNRWRVDAEIVRDLTLAASGLLSSNTGGPSVFPPLPAGVAELSYANNFQWRTSQGADRYRRGMYTFFKRTSPHPTLITFDCPDANTTRLVRETSNTPLQALVTLNNEVFSEASQALAQRVLREAGPTDQQRMGHAIRLCITRQPTVMEVEQFQSLLATCRDYYRSHSEDAVKLISQHPAAGVPAEENAAWVATLRVFLNLDEFLVRD
ncbi:MAG: PSD1 and planctomycete cytochrome C domain-containing protein [Planctomycetaceae bacterium]